MKSTPERRTTPNNATEDVITQRLMSLSQYAFTEIQRCDVKAAAICGTSGAILSVIVAALAIKPALTTACQVALGIACTGLGAALIPAIAAVRPSLSRYGSTLSPFLFLTFSETTETEALERVTRMSAEATRLAYARHLVGISALAKRKLLLLRIATDCLCAGLLGLGIAVLLAWAGI
ncbi:Pycsar system effector family protein [Streptosporangium sandarakinum]|uniref:Pycsar system effector family protein n=1 Tax=Streptosporangium sandarakinum TaxID=1260955 RepID=UPI003794E3FB